MSNWNESAMNNLLPLSNSTVFHIALTEWIYTGDVEDLGENTEICQLCSHPNIRYKFEIHNRVTGYYLYVGSECIKKFELRALGANGKVLNLDESRRKVNKDRRSIEEQAKLSRIINNIMELSDKDKTIEFESFLDYLDEHHALTPKQLCLIIGKLERLKITHRKSDYKMKMKRNREKEQLQDMPKWQLDKIWSCMNNNQRQYCKEHRNDVK